MRRTDLYRVVAEQTDEPIGPVSKICEALLRELASAYHGIQEKEVFALFDAVEGDRLKEAKEEK